MNEVTLSSAEQEYWDKVRREALLTAINKSEDAARQLVVLTALLSTIYFAAISFSDVLKRSAAVPVLLLFALPLPIWLASLWLATNVIVPRTRIITDIRSDYSAIAQDKYRHLRWAYTLLIVSMIVFVVNIVVYFLIIPVPTI